MLHSESVKKSQKSTDNTGAFYPYAALALRRGFTIVELVIVVVVIAILATIVAVSYQSITKDSGEVVLISDLKNAANSLTHTVVKNQPLPTTADAIPKSKGTSYAYRKDSASEFCLEARNERAADKVMHVTQDGEVREGTCPGALLAPTAVGPSQASNQYDYFVELITGAYFDWGIPTDGGSPLLEYRVTITCGASTRAYLIPAVADGVTNNPPQVPFMYSRSGSNIQAYLPHSFNTGICGSSLCGTLNKIAIEARNAVGWGPRQDFTVDPTSC